MSDGLDQAIRLREEGKPEEARRVLLELLAERPDDPDVNYQCAWVHDLLGREREAAPFYERAIEAGLSGKDLEEATIGLGSSYRVLGEYGKAVEILRDGAEHFPKNRALQTFLAMALYNVGESGGYGAAAKELGRNHGRRGSRRLQRGHPVLLRQARRDVVATASRDRRNGVGHGPKEGARSP